LYTDPPSALGFWIPLVDETVENGCLSFARGSHRRTAVKSRFVRKEGGGGTTFEEVKGGRFLRGVQEERQDVDASQWNYMA
jgi:phytanoyl-CoA hydroxylase